MPFSPDFLSTLERIYMLARKTGMRKDPGERQSFRRGASIEFADYRHYTPGDEIRYIDWNVYARHGTLFVKEFTAEESIHVSLLLDASASMGFGKPSKMEGAREVAAAVGYVALASFDTVSLFSFTDQPRVHRTYLRGKPRVFDLLSGLEEIQPGGRTSLGSVLATPLPELKGRSLIILVTDFYDPNYAEALRRLRMKRHQVHVIHIVSREEFDPNWRGRQVLVDLESGGRRDVVLTPDRIRAYRKRFTRFCDEIERFCTANGMRYARVLNDVPLEERLMEIVRKGGIFDLR